jgi:ABC-2 type transport system permease protein
MRNGSAGPMTLSPRRRVTGSPGRTLAALGTLFWLTLRQHVQGRRLIVLMVLFAVPTVIALFARRYTTPANLELILVFTLFPHALVPLAALLYATGMVQDEVEDQTLTYLLVRPLPRWALYVTKLLATVLLAIVLTAFFALVTELAIYWGEPAFPPRVLQLPALFALTLVTYCSVFGCISLFARQALTAGLAYIIFLEGLLANLELPFRPLTVVYYFRLLATRWLGMNVPGWRLRLDETPRAQTAVLVLLVVSLVATVIGAYRFATREFRMKTPEGA